MPMLFLILLANVRKEKAPRNIYIYTIEIKTGTVGLLLPVVMMFMSVL